MLIKHIRRRRLNMNRYDRTYRGIVIQDNDPNHAGRVKVFVPEVNITLLKNWNQSKTDDKMITHMGDNTGTSLTPEIQDRLRKMLPWAEIMLPTFGMSTPAFYHASSNKSFGGNDGGLTSQDSNKTTQAFQQDQTEENNRKNRAYTPDPLGKPPRQSTDQTNLNIGKPTCLPMDCGNSSNQNNNFTFPSIYLSYEKNSCVANLAQSLPKSYSLCQNNIIPPSPSNPVNDAGSLNNTTISNIELSIENPIILVNGKQVDVNATIFGVKCFVPTNNNTINYNPPILFAPSVTNVIPANYSDIPIKMNINGSNKINTDFFFTGNSGALYSYKSGNITINIAANNILNTTLYTNGGVTQMSKIQKILPLIITGLGLLTSLSNIIMPRGSARSPMISRGGGGSNLYSNVNSNLLPDKIRRNSLLGGSNNASRETQNQGRNNLTQYPSDTQANLQGKPDTGGPYRPSDQGNNFKGIVSIPSPGAHVYVRFEQGDANRPIIIGTFAGKNDFEAIYGVPN